MCIPELKKTVAQEFYVLDVKTCKTLLLGRDFLAQMGPVTLDVEQNRIRIGKKWINGVQSKGAMRVNTSETISIPARSEKIISVKSREMSAMLQCEFYSAFKPVKGVYLANARV